MGARHDRDVTNEALEKITQEPCDKCLEAITAECELLANLWMLGKKRSLKPHFLGTHEQEHFVDTYIQQAHLYLQNLIKSEAFEHRQIPAVWAESHLVSPREAEECVIRAAACAWGCDGPADPCGWPCPGYRTF